MSYMEYVYKDNLTKLDYIYWDEYLDHKSEFNECEDLSELLLNANIVADLNTIDDDLFLLVSAISMIIYEHDGLNHDELVKYQNRVEELYMSMENYYEESRNNEGFWKYLDISMDDIFNNIKEKSPFIVKDLTLDIIFAEDYYLFIYSFKEGK